MSITFVEDFSTDCLTSTHRNARALDTLVAFILYEPFLVTTSHVTFAEYSIDLELGPQIGPIGTFAEKFASAWVIAS